MNEPWGFQTAELNPSLHEDKIPRERP
jgi:hypothetical protein